MTESQFLTARGIDGCAKAGMASSTDARPNTTVDAGGGEATGPLPPGGGSHAGAGQDQMQQRQRHQRRHLPCVVLQCGDDVRRPSNIGTLLGAAARPAQLAWSPAESLFVVVRSGRDGILRYRHAVCDLEHRLQSGALEQSGSRKRIGFRNTASAAAFPAASTPVAGRRASCARGRPGDSARRLSTW